MKRRVKSICDVMRPLELRGAMKYFRTDPGFLFHAFWMERDARESEAAAAAQPAFHTYSLVKTHNLSLADGRTRTHPCVRTKTQV